MPIDFSKASFAALRYARKLAVATRNASLTVLHVVEPFHPDMFTDTTDLQRERRRQARKQLRALVARELENDTKSKAVLSVGNPVEAITHFARESGTDLIVISTHGRTGLPRALIGSVAERVVRHAPCPVLVVRGRKR